jgi:hypothetical protein
MARIQVQNGMKVSISSKVGAAARQRYKVYRQVGANPEFILLDTISGGGGAQYGAWNVNAVYQIVCEGWWDYARPTDWMPSREQISTANGGNTTTIRCEDYWSTDGDWDDLIVTVNLASSDNVQNAESGTDPYTVLGGRNR